MPLFHPRVLNRAVKNHPITLLAAHQHILEDWRISIENGQLLQQQETQLHAHFVQKILIEILGYRGFSATGVYHVHHEFPLGRGRVDIALGYFGQQGNQVIAPFELKGAKTKDLDAIMPGRNKSPVEQAWEYGMDAIGAQWVLISNYLELRLYAIGYGRQHYELWSLAQLTEPAEYQRLMLLLSQEHLLEGLTYRLLKESEQVDKVITNQLYQDYNALRQQLIHTLTVDNPKINELDIIYYAQIILDRVLFIAFAEDTGLLPDDSLKQAYAHHDPYYPRPIWENFKGLFEAIDKGNPQLKIPAYNGGLFCQQPLLNHLIVSDALCAQFKNMGDYDFQSEVSVTVLGHIFEQSITDLESLKAEVQGLAVEHVGKRKREGVVYTPDKITRFIVEETVGGYLAERFAQLWLSREPQRYRRGERQGQWKSLKQEVAFWRDYQDILRAMKVVDPACGSGAFLVAVFDYLHAEYSKINNKLADLTGSYDLFDLDKEILNKNLYGVDVNSESIEITKLSLWLKTARYGKVLNSLDNNLRVGDSLIEDVQISPRAFHWQQAFPEVFAQGGFDVVLGNPPYVRQELISPFKPYFQSHYSVYHGVADLYSYFFERGLSLLKTEGKLGFICSSTFFKTGSGENLRRYLLAQAVIEKIVDFGDVQLFAGVTTYPAILVMKKAEALAEQHLSFLKLKQLPEQELSKVFHLQKSIMPQAQLSMASWQLEDEQLAQLRHKIVAGKPTLKEVYGSPYRGILTGLNEAFVIDKATKQQLIAQDAQSAEVIKPFLEGKDLKKWRVEGRELYLILIPKGWSRQHSNLSDEPAAWEWFKAHYPAVAQWLTPFEIKAKKRTDKGEFWWELRACGYYDEFEKIKIVYIEIANKPQFFLDKNQMYFNATAFIIPSNDLFLLGLMNSNLAWFFWKGICTFLRGGFLRLKSQFLNLTPIPTANDLQKTEIATLAEHCQHLAETRYQKQEAIRRRIPDLCPPERHPQLNNPLKSWWTLDFKTFRKEVKKCFKADIPLSERNDWENWLNSAKADIEKHTQQLTQLEQQLNQKVYALFELTEAEIKLIEKSIE